MEMTKNTVIALLTAIMLMSMGAFAFAEEEQNKDNNNCFIAGPDSKQWKNLSPAKQAKVQSILDKHYKSMRTLRTQFWEKHTALDTLASSDNAKKEDIERVTAELKALKAQILEEREKATQDIEKVSGLKLLQAKHCVHGAKGHGGKGHAGGCLATGEKSCAN